MRYFRYENHGEEGVFRLKKWGKKASFYFTSSISPNLKGKWLSSWYSKKLKECANDPKDKTVWEITEEEAFLEIV